MILWVLFFRLIQKFLLFTSRFGVNTEGKLVDLIILRLGLSRNVLLLTITFIFWAGVTVSMLPMRWWRLFSFHCCFPAKRHIQSLHSAFVLIFQLFQLFFEISKFFHNFSNALIIFIFLLLLSWTKNISNRFVRLLKFLLNVTLDGEWKVGLIFLEWWFDFFHKVKTNAYFIRFTTQIISLMEKTLF